MFIDIVEMFMAMGIIYTSDQVGHDNEIPKRITPNIECVNLVEKYIDFFLLLSLQDHKLINTNQYLIACSIASATRKHCNLKPIWT